MGARNSCETLETKFVFISASCSWRENDRQAASRPAMAARKDVPITEPSQNVRVRWRLKRSDGLVRYTITRSTSAPFRDKAEDARVSVDTSGSTSFLTPPP